MLEISALYANGASADDTAKRFNEYTGAENLQKAYKYATAMQSLAQDKKGNYYSTNPDMPLEDILQAYDDVQAIPAFQYLSDEYKALDPQSPEKTEAFKQGVEGLGQALVDGADTADENGEKDGVLSIEEFLAQQNAGDIEGYDELTIEDVETVFNNFDLNSDGFIDGREEASQIAMMDYSDGAMDGAIAASSALLMDWTGEYAKSNLQKFYDFLFGQ